MNWEEMREGIYLRSDLLDVFWKLKVIGNPGKDDVLKIKYRNRQKWMGIFGG